MRGSARAVAAAMVAAALAGAPAAQAAQAPHKQDMVQSIVRHTIAEMRDVVRFGNRKASRGWGSVWQARPKAAKRGRARWDYRR